MEMAPLFYLIHISLINAFNLYMREINKKISIQMTKLSSFLFCFYSF